VVAAPAKAQRELWAVARARECGAGGEAILRGAPEKVQYVVGSAEFFIF